MLKTRLYGNILLDTHIMQPSNTNAHNFKLLQQQHTSRLGMDGPDRVVHCHVLTVVSPAPPSSFAAPPPPSCAAPSPSPPAAPAAGPPRPHASAAHAPAHIDNRSTSMHQVVHSVLFHVHVFYTYQFCVIIHYYNKYPAQDST